MAGSFDWTVKGISMCPTQDNTPSLDVFHQLYEVVFVDPSGLLNLAAMMITADFQRVSKVLVCDGKSKDLSQRWLE